MKISNNAKKAIFLGTLCSIAYLAVYIARNVLSAVTPQMIEQGGYTESYIGKASSLYFVFYAVGQLINGFLGDKIKARYMICGGLAFSGITNVCFVYLKSTPSLALVIYALTGFFLAMIYAPMTKVVSENTSLLYATRCSIGYTFASFLGSPVAGVLATVLVWQNVFNVSSGILVGMAIITFVCFVVFEKRGIVKYNQFSDKAEQKGNIKILFKRQIIKFTLISIITGIIRTTVVFWLPTYISQYLGFSPEKSATIFTIATFVIALDTFIVVFIFERLGRNMDKTIRLMFLIAIIFFVLVYFVKQPSLNIIFIVLAIMGSNGAATMLWSIYCPSLRDTGMVSTATGYLDFVSYIAAAVSSVIFANAVSAIGWGNLILVWTGIVVCGMIVSLPFDKIFKKSA